ncbi:flagellar protein [Sulfurimonas sp.]|nr:flagellar protein [Sulfurimonas sp.]
MLKTILSTLLIFYIFNISTFALEVSIQGAKENNTEYSILHLSDNKDFLCQEEKNDFDEVVKIVCAFSKSPSQNLQKIQNNFFNISTQIKNKTFFLIIKPFFKMKLYPMVFDLTKDDTVFSSDVKLSNKWMIIGYKEKIPYLKDNSHNDTSIKFPFKFSKSKLPYVGSLDMQGNPVFVKRVRDVTEYVRIKKLYAEKKYDYCSDLINEVMKGYPNSLFTAELLLYKIKVFSKLENYDSLIDVAMIYLREHSSDENVPEVLSLLSQAYFKNGLNSDADYFFDRLFVEHKNSVYAKWGYIYKGEMFESTGAYSKAISLYKKSLSETDNIDVAVVAAYSMAKNLIATGKGSQANEYIQKIAKVQPEYFKKRMDDSLDIMDELAESSHFIPAATIAKSLHESINKNYDNYEPLLRDNGLWLSKTEKKQDALAALNLYLEEFEDGMFTQEVKVAKDGLFFDVTDANYSVRVTNYDKLMQEYDGDSIGNKAIYEKAKLLIENNHFQDALNLENDLLSLDTEEYADVQNLITEAAIGTMKNALEQKECNSVLEISSKYKIELSDKWDDGVYACAMKGADFELAQKMADKNINSKDLRHRKKWLYRYIKIDFATGNYSNVIEASKELITLIKNDKESKYLDVYRYIFDTYQRVEDSSKMIDAMVDIERVYKLNYIDIERYVTLMAVGSQRKDSNLVIDYAKKIMSIQNSSSSYAQSPFVEFTLYQAYIDKEENNLALEIIKSLDDRDLDNSNRARQRYLLGSIYDKLWRDDDAKAAYQSAIDTDKDSPWAKLAEGAKGI